MNAALVIIFASMVVALLLGLQAHRGKDMNLEQWSVGGRGFGTIFVFLLLAGEIYTTFTFLGGSGWAYSKGGPAFYILCYGALAYVLSYWLLPVIWRYGTEHGLVSQSDFFSSKYRSPYLGVLVSLVGVIAMVPYLVLQLTGLGIIVSEASYGSISSTAAILIGTAVLTVYAMVSFLAVIALLFTFRGGSAIVSLLLAGYSLVTQLFPALIASLPRRPVVPKEAAATGIIVGVVTVAYLTISGATVATLLPGLPQWIKDLNVGIVALLVNLAALAVVTFVMRALSGAAEGTSPAPV